VTGSSSKAVTELLLKWKSGDKDALGVLLPLVYEELRRIARYHLQKERTDHTLQSTALVHEAFIRMVDQQPLQIQNRAHFFAISSRLMREILVDHARKHRALKRSYGCRLALDDALDIPGKQDLDVLALDAALHELACMDPQQARIVELRFFGGLSIDETSLVLEISPATVKRDWTTARAWLHREMTRVTRS
jgi:RNA polymerase sigma factor (TIGR02999 family)